VVAATGASRSPHGPSIGRRANGNEEEHWRAQGNHGRRQAPDLQPLAIEAAEYFKLKNPAANVTVRDLEGDVQTTVIPTQQPKVRR